MSDNVLLSELEKRNPCILILDGFLKKKSIEGLYLNFLKEISGPEGKEKRIPGMLNICCEEPFRTFVDMYMFLIYQLSYSLENIYIPLLDGGSVISFSDIKKEKNLFDLKNVFADLKEKALEEKIELVFEDYVPMVQVLSYDNNAKLSLIDYIVLHPELMEVLRNRLNSIYFDNRNFLSDDYTKRIEHILLKPLNFFKKEIIACG